MAEKRGTVELRLPHDILAKAEYVAKRENRTLNNHIMLLLRRNIEYFERTHEKISLSPKDKTSHDEKD
jgi:hypothetical protein